jgi:hypothetical protein
MTGGVVWLPNDTATRLHAVRVEHLPTTAWVHGGRYLQTLCRPVQPSFYGHGLYLMPAELVLGTRPPRCKHCLQKTPTDPPPPEAGHQTPRAARANAEDSHG